MQSASACRTISTFNPWLHALQLVTRAHGVTLHVSPPHATADLGAAMMALRCSSPGGWAVAAAAWTNVALQGALPHSTSYVEAMRSLRTGDRWAEAASLARMVRAQEGDAHPALREAVPVPTLAQVFAAQTARACTANDAELLLRHVERSYELQRLVAPRELQQLRQLILKDVDGRWWDASLARLRTLAAVVPMSLGALPTVALMRHLAAVDAAAAGSSDSSPTTDGGWRLRSETNLLCLGAFRDARVAPRIDTGLLGESGSVLIVDRSAITHAFTSVVGESRHHAALVVLQSVLDEMTDIALGASPGAAAARRNLGLLLRRGSRLRVVGALDEAAVRLCAASRYGFDGRDVNYATAALAAELAQVHNAGGEAIRVTVHTRNATLRGACHNVGVETLPSTL
jgi:hypothetical protein